MGSIYQYLVIRWAATHPLSALQNVDMIINGLAKGGFLTMGTKRVGLARTQALIENLKRSLTLTGTTITGATLSGGTVSGCTISGDSNVTGGGVCAMAYSDAGTVSQATGDYDATIALPANALILDMGFKVNTAIGGTGSTGVKINVSFGTTASGAELVTGVDVCNANSSMAAGAAMSVVAQNKGDASGAAFGGIKDAATLWASASRNIFMRTTVAAGAQDADGEVVAYVKYAIINISS